MKLQRERLKRKLKNIFEKATATRAKASNNLNGLIIPDKKCICRMLEELAKM